MYTKIAEIQQKYGNLQPINLPKFLNSAKLYKFATHKCTPIVEDPTHVGCATLYWHFVSWEPEGHYCSSNLSRWEPERRYRCTKSIAIAPFWFSMEHLWTAIMPFWLSTDDLSRVPPPLPHAIFILSNICLFIHFNSIIYNKTKANSLKQTNEKQMRNISYIYTGQ